MALRRFLTLDIGASTLKLGEFVSSSPGDLRLVHFGRAEIQADPVADADRGPQITAELKQMLGGGAFKERRVAVSVSSQVVLTRFMKLPAADEAKIRQMVRYEAAQNVPFPIEEVVWDYQAAGRAEQSDLEIVLVAIKSDLIEGVNRCVEDAGLMVEVVDVAPLAIYNAARFNYTFGEESEDRCTLMLDIGARTTNLIFIEPGKFYMRSIPIAGNTITQSVAQEFEVPFAEAEDLKRRQGFVGLGGAYEDPELESSARLSKIIRNVMTRLHAEVARSINFYKSQQGGHSPSALLLCGGASITPYTDHFFREKMEVEVAYFNPFKNVPFEVPAGELEKAAHSLGEVVGLGLRLATESPVEINLIPPTVTRRRLFGKKVPYFAVAMLGAICMVLGWWVYDALRPHYAPPVEIFQRHPTVGEEVLKRIAVPAWAADPAKWRAEDVAAGKRVYEANCAVCHGEKLDGRGPAADAFRYPIRPADFTDAGTIAQLTLPYVYWRLTIGGLQNQFNSAMPKWVAGDEEPDASTLHANDLSPDEAWQAILYIYRASNFEPRRE